MDINNQNNQFAILTGDTYNNITLYRNGYECDKLFPNSNIVRKINRGSSMKEGDYKQLEMEEGMQIILKFPEESEKEECIKREVKEILSNIFQEFLAKIL